MRTYRAPFIIILSLCVLTLMKVNIASANNHFDMTKLDDQTQKQIKAACYFQKMDSSKVYADCLAKETRKVFSATKHRLKTSPTSSSEMPTPRWSNSADNAATNWGGRQTASSIFKNIAPSVFMVLATKTQEDLKNSKEVSQGSAVAISSSTLLTNCHVTNGNSIIVLAINEELKPATIIKSNKAKDTCVLRVKSNLTPIPRLRRYSSLENGETVYALGAPKSLSNTLTEGIISSLRRHDGTNFIQTSASISPGSSGGGLFDKAGNLIGITTFGIKDGNNLNFAVDVGEYWK